MPKIPYITKSFSKDRLAKIDAANSIIAEYQSQGFELTLRQLYYQFVSRGLIPNSQKEYKNLGDVINDARLAGLVDWEAIVDRTRNLRSVGHWGEPSDIIRSAAYSFRIDKWQTQPTRVEVWIEKDALVGVIESVCNANDVPYFSCRGYTSQSELWAAGQRMIGYGKNNQNAVVIHLGDHDPSGIDMTRDIQDRLDLFTEGQTHTVMVQRIALNMPQVQQYSPPPNPAKLTDSRCEGYIKKFGDESWELDALDPKVIAELITKAIKQHRDEKKWAQQVAIENTYRKQLDAVSANFGEVVEHLGI